MNHKAKNHPSKLNMPTVRLICPLALNICFNWNVLNAPEIPQQFGMFNWVTLYISTTRPPPTPVLFSRPSPFMWIPATHTQTHRRRVRCINEQSSEPAADVTFIPAIEPLIITAPQPGRCQTCTGSLWTGAYYFTLKKAIKANSLYHQERSC